MIRILFIVGLYSLSSLAQINPKNIDIVRDAFGVPHIYGKTDADVAYGLAWAHAEDDFKTIQQGYLAGNAILENILGRKVQLQILLHNLLVQKKLLKETMIKK